MEGSPRQRTSQCVEGSEAHAPAAPATASLNTRDVGKYAIGQRITKQGKLRNVSGKVVEIRADDAASGAGPGSIIVATDE